MYVCGGKGEAMWQATWQLGWGGIGMVFRRPGEDMTGWKKPPQRFRTETQADKKTQAGIQSNSQFCCSQHKHATSPWHTRFSSLLAPPAKNFSSFRTEEGSKQTLSARHQVSTYSLCCHKTTVLILIPNNKKSDLIPECYMRCQINQLIVCLLVKSRLINQAKYQAHSNRFAKQMKVKELHLKVQKWQKSLPTRCIHVHIPENWSEVSLWINFGCGA